MYIEHNNKFIENLHKLFSVVTSTRNRNGILDNLIAMSMAVSLTKMILVVMTGKEGEYMRSEVH